MLTDKTERCLEVGRNDSGEVVINHPDLKPDVNGIGHIVFSPDQARNLAALLQRHANEADEEIRERCETERRKAAVSIPVDRGQRVLSNGAPVGSDHTEIDPATGQQKGYVVLSASERAKGFVRPLRCSYRHVGRQAPASLRDLTPEEVARFGYAKFEPYPESELPKTGRFWTRAELDKLGKGCGTVTTMGRSIAETYARDPGFYGGTFCCGCRVHLPLEEFVWEGTSERVGS